jgi:hypothetical protein
MKKNKKTPTFTSPTKRFASPCYPQQPCGVALNQISYLFHALNFYLGFSQLNYHDVMVVDVE